MPPRTDPRESLGYQVEWKTIRSCDQGAHTTRERLYMLARRDGQPIVWPEQTHFKQKEDTPLPKRWKPAAECIDFSDLGNSIFGRPKDLAEATQRRIAAGISKFVLRNPNPFIVPIAHYNGADTAYSIDEPLRTITAATKGGEFSLVMPMVVPATQQSAKGGFNQAPEHDLCSSVTTQSAHLRGNCGTSDSKHRAPVADFRSRQLGASIGHGDDAPIGTISASGDGNAALAEYQLSQGDEHRALGVAAFLMRYHSTGG